MPFKNDSTWQWWESRRLRYNIGLIVAGIFAFACYLIVCFTLLPRVLDPGRINAVGLETFVQAIAYLVLMVVANLFYCLGPMLEDMIRPTNVNRYRVISYRLGFWFSALLPFSIPTLLAVLILFFPDRWK